MTLAPRVGVESEWVGWAGLLVVYAATYLAAIAIPGTRKPGYCIDPATGKPQVYVLNGFACLCAVVICFVALVVTGHLAGDFFYAHFWACLRASCFVGVVISTLLLLRGRQLLRQGLIDRRPRCPTADAPEGGPKSDTTEFDARSLVEHWYCGLSEYNPRGPGGVDLKMWLYLVGAVQLQLSE